MKVNTHCTHWYLEQRASTDSINVVCNDGLENWGTPPKCQCVMILSPIFHFLPFPPTCFCTLSHSFPTHSLMCHLDCHPVTWQVTWWVTWPFCSQLSHATAPQSTVPIVHPLWTASSWYAIYRLPAHDGAILRLPAHCQLMMWPYYMWLHCSVTSIVCDISFVYKCPTFWWLGPKPNLVFNPRLVASTQDSQSQQPESPVASKSPWSSPPLISLPEHSEVALIIWGLTCYTV